jgi:hypothetical protein
MSQSKREGFCLLFLQRFSQDVQEAVAVRNTGDLNPNLLPFLGQAVVNKLDDRKLNFYQARQLADAVVDFTAFCDHVKSHFWPYGFGNPTEDSPALPPLYETCANHIVSAV